METSLELARKPEIVFRKYVPGEFCLAAVKCVNESYEAAFAKCSEWPDPEAHDLRPHERRAFVETGLRDVAGRYGAVASAQPNCIGNCNHTEIRFGPVILTASFVETPNTVVRSAEFRKTFARSNQLYLFESPAPPSFDDPLYCILLHGVSDDPRKPHFIQIRFPTPDCEGYVPGSMINLLREFENMRRQTETVPEQGIPRSLVLPSEAR